VTDRIDVEKTPYQVSKAVNPSYLRGDFDGDCKADIAIAVERAGKRGILIVRGRSKAPVILGAGVQFEGMVDLNFDSWQIHPRGPVSRGVEEGRPPKLLGEALLLEWDESASALAYWDGRRFVWYQQGD